jgi:hypothetical protein
MTRDVPPPQRPPILNDSFTAAENIPPGETLMTLCTAIDSGRMGKRCSWLQLEAEFWPDLAFLAEDRFITLEPSAPNR